MAQRLMTPLCFASILAAAPIAEGAIAGAGPKAAPAATGRAEAPARNSAPLALRMGAPAKRPS